MPPTWTIIRAASLVPTPWRNGRGTTRDLLTRTAPDGAILYQVGIADLEQDAPFSHYPHCDRVFTPIAGTPPPELAFSGGPFEPCPLLIPKRFPGDIPTLSRIPAPGRAFNAVVDRRHHQADVEVQTAKAGQTVTIPDAPIVVIHCLSGQLSTADTAIGPGDTLSGPALPAITASQDSIIIRVAIR